MVLRRVECDNSEFEYFHVPGQHLRCGHVIDPLFQLVASFPQRLNVLQRTVVLLEQPCVLLPLPECCVPANRDAGMRKIGQNSYSDSRYLPG